MATRLINAGVEHSLVQTQLRHADISTTRKFYYFDNRTATEKSKAIERAIGRIKGVPEHFECFLMLRDIKNPGNPAFMRFPGHNEQGMRESNSHQCRAGYG